MSQTDHCMRQSRRRHQHLIGAAADWGQRLAVAAAAAAAEACDLERRRRQNGPVRVSTQWLISSTVVNQTSQHCDVANWQTGFERHINGKDAWGFLNEKKTEKELEVGWHFLLLKTVFSALLVTCPDRLTASSTPDVLSCRTADCKKITWCYINLFRKAWDCREKWVHIMH